MLLPLPVIITVTEVAFTIVSGRRGFYTWRNEKIWGVDLEVAHVSAREVIGLFHYHRVQTQPGLGRVHSKALQKQNKGTKITWISEGAEDNIKAIGDI